MKYCISCELAFPLGSLFCRRCGIPLTITQPNGPGDDSSIKSPIEIDLSQWIGLAVGIFCLMLQYFFRAEALAQIPLVAVILGCAVVVTRWGSAIRILELTAQGIERKLKKTIEQGKLSRWLIRPTLGICELATKATRRVADPYVRNGMRASLWMVLGALAITLTFVVALAVLYVVIAIAVLIFMAWLGFKILGAYLGVPESDEPRRELRPSNDWLGNRRTDIYEDGKKVGEIRPNQDFLGNPKEEVYRGTKKVAEQVPTTDWLGQPRKDIYEGGKKVGEIRPGTDLLGDPREEVYRDGKKVGEQVPTEDWLGNPRKDLRGSGHPGTSRNDPKKNE